MLSYGLRTFRQHHPLNDHFRREFIATITATTAATTILDVDIGITISRSGDTTIVTPRGLIVVVFLVMDSHKSALTIDPNHFQRSQRKTTLSKGDRGIEW